MSVFDRLFPWHFDILSLYPDGASPSAMIAGGLITSLLTTYKDVHLKLDDEDVEGRATIETWKYPLAIASGWAMDCQSVFDASLATLLQIRLQFGRGPYWMFARNTSDSIISAQVYGRVLISNPEWHFSQSEVSQGATLKGVGQLYFGPISF